MKTSHIVSALLMGSIVIFSGCSSSDSDEVNESIYTYSVKVLNLTASQAMSPIIVSTTSLFSVGESASEGLEKLAESGDNSSLVNEDSVSGTKLIVPSQSDEVVIETYTTQLSVASMLVKTNDAFIGLDSYDVSSLNVDEVLELELPVYDAGTEENSETNITVPGLGGEGYNSQRETSNQVLVHSGVISQDDGLVSSNLSAMDKFNNPAAKVIITRTK